MVVLSIIRFAPICFKVSIVSIKATKSNQSANFLIWNRFHATLHILQSWNLQTMHAG